MVRTRWWWLALTVGAVPAAGCGLVHRPYTDDPILRERQPVWGDPGRARGPDHTPHAEPAPPNPPRVLTLAELQACAEVVTSR